MKKALILGAATAALMASPRPDGVVGSVFADAGTGDIEQLLGQVKSELKRVGDDVKHTAENALEESRKTGAASEEVKNTADKLLVDQAKLNDAQSRLEGRLEQLETRNTDLEQMLSSRNGGGDQRPQSVGQQVSDSDQLKAYVEGGVKGSVSITVQNAITSTTPGGGGLIWSDRDSEIVGLPRRRMTIRQLLQQGNTGSNLIEYTKQVLRDNQAAVVAEEGTMAESDYTWEKADAPVRTIGHFVHLSEQAVADAAQLQSEIDGELQYGLMYNEELELLSGDGTGEHLSGLVPNATAYAAAFVPASVSMVDTVRLSLLQATLAEYPADGVVMHPTDWARIELTKDAQERYIFANVVQMAGPQLWGRPVVETQAMTEDKFLTGAFHMAAKIWDRSESEVQISSEDRDNFITNMLTARIKKRLALAIRRPTALIYGDFGNIA